MRKIVSYFLLVGTGSLLLLQTLLHIRNNSLPLLFFVIILGILFMVGVYYHIKGTKLR